MVASSRRVRVVCFRSGWCRHLDHGSALDGRGVHFERQALRTRLRYTGPYYLAMIAPVIALGIIASGTSVWIALGVIIIGGSKLIWWATSVHGESSHSYPTRLLPPLNDRYCAATKCPLLGLERNWLTGR